MKILIVSRPRCRTSLMCQASSLFYNIPDLHEGYDYHISKALADNQRYALLKKTPSLQQVNQSLCSHIRTISDMIEKENGVIKFFPRVLVSYFFKDLHEQAAFRDFETFKYICETNISELFKLKMYDQIVFLERDLVDSLMSLSYAVENKQVLYTHQEAKYASKKQKKVRIDNNFVLDKVNFSIFEYYLYLQVKNFITNNFNNCTTLTYDTCVDYIKNNYNNQSSVRWADPEFDYANNIENYTELKSYILETSEKYSTLVPKLNFK